MINIMHYYKSTEKTNKKLRFCCDSWLYYIWHTV